MGRPFRAAAILPLLLACDARAGDGLVLSSTAFADGGPLPAVHTCDGPDRSPPLSWSGVPAGAKSLVLVVHDPDAPDPAAPRVDWVHWLLWDLPPGAGGIPEGGPLPPGTRSGVNDFGKASWGGPCPPVGRHRYFFDLYALDRALGDLGPSPRRADLEAALAGHVLASAQRVGTYRRAVSGAGTPGEAGAGGSGEAGAGGSGAGGSRQPPDHGYLPLLTSRR